MDELSFLQERLETTVREKQALYEELQRETARLQTALECIYRSKSWRWTAPIRNLEWKLQERRKNRISYRFFAHIKKLWMEMGSPYPRLVRFFRHRIIGKIWPPKIEISV